MAGGVYSQRFQTVAQMAVETAEEITRSAENWKRFLRTAGEVYRYPFKDQLLIYAQRPELKAVTTMDYWNKQMKCWIDRQAVSVWFDETGMWIKAGMSAKGKGAGHIPWEEIEQRIHHMVKEGSYIDRAAALFVVPKEVERVAEKV